MVNKNEASWQQNYEALKAYIAEHGHLPNKRKKDNRYLHSKAKYQKRKIKEGTLEKEKQELVLSLLATRVIEHTGGRRKKTEMPVEAESMKALSLCI